MPGQGVGTGIGIGIGQGLGDLGDAIAKRKERQREERDKQADVFVGQMHQIRDSIVNAGGVDTPEGQKLSAQLKDVIEKHNALYPPHETPALIQRIQKLFGKQPGKPTPDPRASATVESEMATASNPNKMLQEMQQFKAALKANGATDEQIQIAFQKKYGTGTPNPYTTMKEQMIAAGLTEEQASEAVRIYAGLEPAAKNPATNDLSEYRRQLKETGFSDSDIDKAMQIKVGLAPKAAAIKVGTEADFVKSEYGDNATPDQKLEAHRLWTGSGAETVGTHVIQVPQPDGSIKSYEVTTTSRKQLPGTSTGGGTSNPVPPKTPGEARNRFKDLGITGGRETAAQTDADKKYGDAVKLASLADNALTSPSAANDKLLAGALIRGTEGRFNAAQYDNLTRKAGLANTFEQWMNNVSSGELTDEIRQQLVNAAKANLEGAKKQREASRTSPSSDTKKPPAVDANDPLGILGKKP